MASTPIVSVDDVVNRYLEGNLRDEFTDEQIDTKIGDAVDYAADHWGSVIESRISGGQLRPRSYKRIIAEAVLRVLRNPGGYKNESDGGYAYGRDAEVAPGYLYFSEDEIADLSGAQQSLQPGSFRIGIDRRGWGH